MEKENTILTIVRELSYPLINLLDRLKGPDIGENIEELLYELGWLSKGQFPFLEELLPILENITSIIEDDFDITNLKTIIGDKGITGLIKKIESIKSLDNNSLKAIQGDLNEFKKQFPRQLLDKQVSEFFFFERPEIGYFLQLLGILKRELVSVENRPDYILYQLNWNLLPKIISAPFQVFKDTYQWDTNDFDHFFLLENLKNVTNSYGLNLSDFPIKTSFLNKETPITETDEKYQQALSYFFVDEGSFYGNSLYLGLGLFSPTVGENHKQGLALVPLIEGSINERISIGDNLFVKFSNTLNLSDTVALSIHPENDIELLSNIEGATGRFEISIVNEKTGIEKATSEEGESEESTEIFLLGDEDGSSLTIKSTSFKVGFELQGNKQSSLYSEIGLEQGKFLIKANPEEADGFISQVLPPEGFSMDFDCIVGFDNHSGLYFKGSSGLEIVIPKRINFKKIIIDGLIISIIPEDNSIPIYIEAGVIVKLGIITAAIRNVGLSTRFNFPENNKGNKGFFDIDMGFKGPELIGISIDSDAITGGGFLEIDRPNNRYAGMLSLNLEKITLNAIGLITTKLPNNQKGFSMLVSISAVFNPAIQIAAGFTLNGVGGLIGIHRTMKVEVLRNRIQSGAINSIMFPVDAIANADKIISDLRAVFPPMKKHFVVAPFVKLAWGTPVLVEADIGVFLEFPFKGRIIVLGSLLIALPNKSAPLVELYIDILGDFNFAKQSIRIEGVLRNYSNVVGLPLTGGFAFVLNWGKNPKFLFSAGGYHPRYKKPAAFPTIQRVGTLIQYGKNVTLTCEFYQAITSNSFQVGFRADLFATYKKARVYGFFSFNALLQFDPFYFEADIHMGVLIKRKKKTLAGVEFYFLLSGPKPWRVNGYAKIKVWFIRFKLKFDFSWGGKQKRLRPTIAPIELLDRITTQIKLPSSWTAQLSSDLKGAAILRELEETEKANLVLLHPSGYLQVRQMVIPLNRNIEKVGNRRLIEQPSYHINSIQIGLNGVVTPVQSKDYQVKEYFSRGQLEDLTDAQKISTRDFELMQAGVNFSTIDDYQFSGFADTHSNYEDIEIKHDLTSIIPSKEKPLSTRDWEEQKYTRTKASDFTEREFQSIEEVIDFEEEETQYIVSTDTLEFPPSLGEQQAFDNYSLAKEYLDNILHGNTEEWQIISVAAYELELNLV